MIAAASRATIADVAKRAGVSIATVSRVLNGTGQVAQSTAARVQTAVAELNYKPHTAAKSLASKRTNILGLLLPEISGDFIAHMLRGIESAVNQSGFDLLISTHRHRAGNGARGPLGPHNTDGLLVFTTSLPDSELIHLHESGFPIVLLYKSPPAADIPCVNVENKSGARKLVDHLIEVHDYRRIAFLTGPEDNEDSYWREAGYRESLAAHGIPFDPSLVGVGGFDEDEGKVSVRQWLADGVQFDALFAGDDEAAIGALAVFNDVGRRVPDEVAVVGFDDLPIARLVTPPLTTVRAPTEKAGYEAAAQLIRLIRTGAAEAEILLPTQLIVRRSCGCA